jgi:hypothetical protein
MVRCISLALHLGLRVESLLPVVVAVVDLTQ